MRHFFLAPAPISGLSLGVTTRAASRALVAGSGLSQAASPTYRSAEVVAKQLPAVTKLAQLYLRVTLLAVEKPVERTADRGLRPAVFWIRAPRSAKLTPQLIVVGKGSAATGPFVYLGIAIFGPTPATGPISDGKCQAEIWAKT